MFGSISKWQSTRQAFSKSRSLKHARIKCRRCIH